MSFSTKWIHHDGSALYVSNPAPKPGDEVEIRIRISNDVQPEQVVVRTVHDGEPHVVDAVVESKDEIETWWVAQLPILNRRSHYRWGLSGGNVGYGWLNAEGWFDFDVSDASDFALSTASLPPQWGKTAVVYQVFPDRFAKSDKKYEAPDWVVPREWEMHPEGRSPNTGKEWFGGDLWGAADRLSHLEELGANVIYFTPFFPGRSTHRYDASTFDRVDPLLGGDEAFIHLCKTAHSRNIRVMGDITLNHSGAKHEWFLKALEGHPIFSEFYTFNPSYKDGYATWLGVSSLPKFNYKSDSLKEVLISEHDSIIRKWLREPFNMDGWRVDVANMSGRQGDVDFTHDVARITRHAMEDEGEDKLLIAEHFHDAGPDLDGDGWHGSMNYAAFMKPVWNWLVNKDYDGKWLGLPFKVPSFTGPNMVNSIKSFSSRMPWRSYIFSWSLLDSHDTARIRSVTGRERHHVAAAMLMTLPGTPMIFQGDEIGAEGLWGEDARTTFPWEHRDKWDIETFDLYKQLISLRKSNEALIDGGLRWVQVTDDLVCYLRETPKERILVAVSRNAVENVAIDLKRANINSTELLLGGAKLSAEGLLSIAGSGIGIWSVK